MSEIILARIKKGVVVPTFDRYGVVGEFLKKHEGKEVLIEYGGSLKTQKQLGYLFGVVFRAMSDYTGFTLLECYQVMQERFARYVRSFRGKPFEFTQGLSGMKKLDAGRFIDDCVRYGREELKLVIPDPDPEYQWKK